MSFVCPFRGIAPLAAAAALVLLAPGSMLSARAQVVQQAALSATKSDNAAASASQTTGTGNGTVTAVDQPAWPPAQSLTNKAIEKVKEVAKSAGDIFSRVPCLPPKGGVNPVGTL